MYDYFFSYRSALSGLKRFRSSARKLINVNRTLGGRAFLKKWKQPVSKNMMERREHKEKTIGYRVVMLEDFRDLNESRSETKFKFHTLTLECVV